MTKDDPAVQEELNERQGRVGSIGAR